MIAGRVTLLIPAGTGVTHVIDLDESGADIGRATLNPEELASRIRSDEQSDAPRWVLRRSAEFVGPLLDAGVRLQRVWDLSLCHTILATAGATLPSWPRADHAAPPAPALFEWEAASDHAARPPDDAAASLAQWRAQIAAARTDQRLLLLCQAESAGGVIAEELHAAGLPWDRARHEEILDATLGPRSPATGVPAHMAELAGTVRALLGDAHLAVDSPAQLLPALRRAGIGVASTSRWELAEHDHPAIAPLLAYKKLARLYTANAWNWLDEWVRGGRFRPVYITGGVVTGRWASAGGGALQIPRALRDAVRADPGWTLVVADVAQLEPRMLAAMSGDRAMADAARGADLYEGVVASGAVATRDDAKYAVLGAMYGATTGPSGALVPRLRRVYPRAMHLVDAAAETGAAGGAVHTWLGRTSPPPSEGWTRAQRAASLPGAGAAEERRARQAAAERGRFTRNFVVQGTAAEWSLIWLAEIRHRLAQLPGAQTPAAASGRFFAHRAHLAFFLHDEVIVHVPEELADSASDAVTEAARIATRRLFGDFPIDVPLDLRIARSAHK